MAQKTARWSLQDAKARFSEVVRRCLASGPQVVTRNGEDAVVIVAARDYHRARRADDDRSLAQFLAESPLADVTLEIERPRGPGRPVRF